MERKVTKDTEKSSKRPARKQSGYGQQLSEKQKVKKMYGLREKQFRRFFQKAVRSREGAPGENLLSLLERRIDNTIFRLKLAETRRQARQIVVHGHICVNGKKVTSPSYLVSPNDVISLDSHTVSKKAFLDQVIDKRLNMGIKVPDWLELIKDKREGRVLRDPIRSDITVPIEEHHIVELFSR